MNFEELRRILDTGTRDELNLFCDENELEIVNGKIYHRDREKCKKIIEFWDKRQLVKKINLNS